MNLQLLLRRALPHVLVLASFVLAISVYFNPLVFKGYALKQGDAGQWAGAAQEIIEHRAKHGEEPLWSNGMFGGMPAYVISVVYPGEAVAYVEKVLTLGLPYPANILLVALICYYILMLALGRRPAEAALGAVAFTFFTFSFVSIEAGHNSKVRAMAMAPLVLAGIALMYRDRRWLGFALTALGMALHIHAGHYQITYYLAMFCAFIGVGMFLEALRVRQVQAFIIQSALLVLAAGVGVGANAGRLLTLQEYAPYSMRGKSELTPKAPEAGLANKPTDGGLDRDYVFRWSNQVGETFTLLVPSFRGGGSQEPIDKKGPVADFLRNQGYDASQIQGLPLYWGDQPFTSGPVYAGAIVILLAVLGLAVLPGTTGIWLSLAILFSVVLTWGKHWEGFNYFMYDHFPAYRQFRSVTMAIVIAQWALPWLGVLGLGRFVQMVEQDNATAAPQLRRKLMLAAGIVGGLLLAFALIPSLAGDFTTPNDEQMGKDNMALVSAMIEERESMLRGDAFRSLVFVLLAVGLLWALMRRWLKPALVVPALAVLVLADLWAVNSRYLNKSSFERNYYEQRFTPSAADERMRQALPYHEYRVLNLRGTFEETQTSYFHQSLGGYSPAKVRRYQDLIEGPLSENIQRLTQMFSTGATSADSVFGQLPVLNMLNTRFVKFGDKAEEVIDNPRALGTAWFVGSVRAVNSPDEEIAAINAPGFDPRAVAVIDQSKFKTKANLFNTAGATAKTTDWRSNKLTYEVNTPGPGLLVMSEIYYPKGWVATIDGQPAELLRADYALRALEVPAGKHTVVLSFEPESFKLGNLVSSISSVLIYVLLGAGIWMAYKRQKATAQAPAAEPVA